MLEHDFILNYARTNPKEFAGYKTLDWRYIARQASFHKVAPLLYNNIKGLDIPQVILKDLEKIYTYTAFHNMLYLEELKQIIEISQKVNIKIIILKGPVLAQETYGNIALRPFNDIDILIQKKDLDQLTHILTSSGYHAQNINFYKKYHFHLPLTKIGKIPIHLELHWELVDQFILNRIDMNKIWSESSGNHLSSESNILYLLLHIEKHAFFNKAVYDRGNPRDWIFTNPCGNQLIWYTDLYEFINRNTVNWDKLIKTAKEWCINNVVYYNLYILSKLYTVRIPQNLPLPKLGMIKRSIYNFVLKRNNIFKLNADMQLRPLRAIDLINYLFPHPDILRKFYYCNKNPTYITIYIVHFLKGLKNIFEEFVGIFSQILIYNRGRRR